MKRQDGGGSGSVGQLFILFPVLILLFIIYRFFKNKEFRLKDYGFRISKTGKLYQYEDVFSVSLMLNATYGDRKNSGRATAIYLEILMNDGTYIHISTRFQRKYHEFIKIIQKYRAKGFPVEIEKKLEGTPDEINQMIQGFKDETFDGNEVEERRIERQQKLKNKGIKLKHSNLTAFNRFPKEVSLFKHVWVQPSGKWEMNFGLRQQKRTCVVGMFVLK